jgi:nicotinate-nucleotide adenylyltransferase
MNDLKPTHNTPPRIGLFGGTFDPIHRGHLQVAEDVLQQFGLDRIWIIPCALPPHKTDGVLAAAEDRLAMARIAIANRRNLRVSDIEIQRKGTSYTIDTLREISRAFADGTQLYFLVGVDAFLEMHTWKSYRQLFNFATFVVMTRPDAAQPSLSLRDLLLTYTLRHISDGYAFSKNGNALEHPEKNSIYPASVTPVAIASSRIRDMIRDGQTIHQWVGAGVADYIVNKGLYR